MTKRDLEEKIIKMRNTIKALRIENKELKESLEDRDWKSKIIKK